MHPQRLPFWQFFHDVEKALSYERWTDKYKLFIGALLNRQIPSDPHDLHFIRFCKALYLQDQRDEEKFESLLRQAITREQDWLRLFLQTQTKELAATEPDEESKSGTAAGEQQPKNDTAPDMPMPGADGPAAEEEKVAGPDKAAGETEDNTVYYNMPFEATGSMPAAGAPPTQPINFLLTDEYFPVTRREMVKGWQFLRRQEKGRKDSGFDLPATIEQIARDGLFLQPKFKTGLQNREDAIIIFADYRGSMTAFHELTNRLIRTARGEGGHPRAPVFYFQNYPVGFVYKQPNLTEPVKIKEALLKTNRHVTLAIVISDAGAARGNPEAKDKRVRMTEFLLKHLSDSCAHTVWLNPMPYHRWKGTAAEAIREKVFLMAPIFETDQYNFQDTLRTILKQHIKKEKTAK